MQLLVYLKTSNCLVSWFVNTNRSTVYVPADSSDFRSCRNYLRKVCKTLWERGISCQVELVLLSGRKGCCTGDTITLTMTLDSAEHLAGSLGILFVYETYDQERAFDQRQ